MGLVDELAPKSVFAQHPPGSLRALAAEAGHLPGTVRRRPRHIMVFCFSANHAGGKHLNFHCGEIVMKDHLLLRKSIRRKSSEGETKSERGGLDGRLHETCVTSARRLDN